MRIVCISDTHGVFYKALPEGDVLIHAGDFSRRSILEEVDEFAEWLAEQPHAHKIVVAGNHDVAFERDPEEARKRLLIDDSITYLQDSGMEIDGVKFWGSPWQPEFYDWAFNLPRGKALDQKWKLIPKDTDVLITHGPPFGFLDECPHFRWRHVKEKVGCRELARHVQERVQPKLHVFGHIHESAGVQELDGTLYINACTMDGRYMPVHRPHIVDFADHVTYVGSPPS